MLAHCCSGMRILGRMAFAALVCFSLLATAMVREPVADDHGHDSGKISELYYQAVAAQTQKCHHFSGTTKTVHAGCSLLASLPESQRFMVSDQSTSVRRTFSKVALSGEPVMIHSPPPKSSILL